ncbi:MAG: nitrate/nitrite transporter NrtS [Nitrososphaerales archaeon]|nr:nitrate/nitrite transporter NrtS [Nitrososphaerales archaeon]
MRLYTKDDLRVAVLLAAVVGSWLVAINQGHALLSGQSVSSVYGQLFLNFATPFLVSTFTSILRNRSKQAGSS